MIQLDREGFVATPARYWYNNNWPLGDGNVPSRNSVSCKVRMKKNAFIVCWLGFAVVIAFVGTSNASQPPKKIESCRLPNALKITDKVISGGQPDGEQAFEELQRLGVRTVISVDGAKPDVALAKKHGLRYVHLPHGYDGIPHDRLLDLTKAIRDLPGPIYIHCHHGKHRSPAAAAAACISAGTLDSDNALQVLKIAGTSEGYRGLFQSVTDAKQIDENELEAKTVEFREVVQVAPTAEAMVALEHTHDHLKLVASAGWTTSADHPDIDPAHEALLLREHFTELLRTEETKRQPQKFIELMQHSEAESKSLEDGLRGGKASPKELTALFERVTANCKACHQEFRDIPLSTKASRH